MTLGWLMTYLGVAAANFYVGYHNFIVKYKKNAKIKRILALSFQALLTILTIIYFLNFFKGNTDNSVVTFLSYIAGFSLVTLCYAGIFSLIHDIVRIINRFAKIPEKVKAGAAKIFQGGLTMFALAMIIGIVSFFPAKEFSVTEYDLVLDKKNSSISELNIAFIADVHMGSLVREKQLSEIVKIVNDLDVDVIMLGGDIYDEGTSDQMLENSSKILSELESKYGAFFVFGNHDFVRLEKKDVINAIESAGIKMLINEAVLIDDEGGKDGFYLLGLEDKRSSERAALKELTDTFEANLPAILLDHQPFVDESASCGHVDLQLSGHTHNGQIFPFHIVDPIINTFSYGYFKCDDMQLLVSSGTGAFGFPCRLGSANEIVYAHIMFE